MASSLLQSPHLHSTKVFWDALKPDGTSASTASAILDDPKGGGTYTPVMYHGWVLLCFTLQPPTALFVGFFESDGLSASAASVILDSANGGITHSPVMCHTWALHQPTVAVAHCNCSWLAPTRPMVHWLS